MLEVFDNDRINRLSAIRGTAALPLPYKYTDTARANKALLDWS